MQSSPVGGYTRCVFNAPELEQTFGVDTEAGEVDLWSDDGAMAKDPPRLMPNDVRAAKSLAFLKSHYPGYEKSGLKQWLPGKFNRRFDNGTWDFTLAVTVGLCGRSSIPCHYTVIRRGRLYVCTDARISKKAAEATALGVYAGMPASDKLGMPGVKSVFIAKNYGLWGTL